MGVTVAESRVVEMVLNNPTLVILGAVILGLAVWVRTRGKSTTRLPPQPPATPVLGHLPELIRENKARTWHLRLNDWARTYGSIFGVRSGYIVDYYINSDVMVKEIFDKKSAQTADRPTWIMSSTILNNDFNVLFLKASDPTWKNQRKVINQLVTNVQKADEIIPHAISDTFPGMNVIDLMPSLGKLPMFLKPWERKGRARYRRDLAWAMKRLEVRPAINTSIFGNHV
ncbi:hypothetical protein N0V92_011002 [Colletotrichum tropicale]|nr:hypothetical protein N0V92_011002 [Colletotrichum tropicale]